MRNIKTGIAVFLAALAGYIGVVQTPIYTVSVCIFSIKNTIKESIQYSKDRILGTLLGGFIGYLFALFSNGNIILSSIGVVIVIYVCQLLKIADSSAIASVTFSAIVIGVGENHPLIYSITRTMDTIIGILISLFVNFGISRYRYLKYLIFSFNSNYNDCIKIVSKIVNESNYSYYTDLKLKFDDLNLYYTQLTDEVVYSSISGDFKYLNECFNICEQLLHHCHGLNILEKSSYNDTLIKESINNYHLDVISNILPIASKLELSLDKILHEK